MEDTNVIGGVSPVKKRGARQGSRGGKAAGRATSTGKRRGGYAKSAGKRGAGGPNVGGYNVMTRFTPGKPWSPPVSGGTTIIPDFGKLKDEKDPNSKNKKDPNYPYKVWTPGTEGSEKIEKVLKKDVGTWDYDQGNPTYSQAWDANLENIKNKYENFDAYVEDQKNIKEGKYKGASKEDIEKSMYEEKVTRVKGTDGYYTYYDASGKEISKDEYDRTKAPGKMKLGGYRAMHGTSK